MNAGEADKVAFGRALRALRPYLDDLVIVGGWAHRLFGQHARARATGFEPLMTEDADIAAPTHLRKKEESIAVLLKREGFAESFHGDDQPPVSQYHLGDEDGGLYVEFLVPLVGSGHRRDGRRDATATVAGVTAQKLRHVDILVREPWTVRLGVAQGFPLGSTGFKVQIANPVSYLAQKLLVLPERKPDKQAKDVLYVHDTLLIFAHALDELADLWKQMGPKLHANTRRDLDRRRTELFAGVTDRARNAAVIAASTARADPPSAERLVATCRVGLARIFG